MSKKEVIEVDGRSHRISSFEMSYFGSKRVADSQSFVILEEFCTKQQVLFKNPLEDGATNVPKQEI